MMGCYLPFSPAKITSFPDSSKFLYKKNIGDSIEAITICIRNILVKVIACLTVDIVFDEPKVIVVDIPIHISVLPAPDAPSGVPALHVPHH